MGAAQERLKVVYVGQLRTSVKLLLLDHVIAWLCEAIGQLNLKLEVRP